MGPCEQQLSGSHILLTVSGTVRKRIALTMFGWLSEGLHPVCVEAPSWARQLPAGQDPFGPICLITSMDEAIVQCKELCQGKAI